VGDKDKGNTGELRKKERGGRRPKEYQGTSHLLRSSEVNLPRRADKGEGKAGNSRRSLLHREARGKSGGAKGGDRARKKKRCFSAARDAIERSTLSRR